MSCSRNRTPQVSPCPGQSRRALEKSGGALLHGWGMFLGLSSRRGLYRGHKLMSQWLKCVLMFVEERRV
jgi:hypothetical protein